jgi:hypothetical protein
MAAEQMEQLNLPRSKDFVLAILCSNDHITEETVQNSITNEDEDDQSKSVITRDITCVN